MRCAIVVAVAVLAAACSSSSEPLAFDLSHSIDFESDPPMVPFVVEGASADAGVVCSGGTFTGAQEFDLDGNELSDEAWADEFDQALETGGVAEMTAVKEFTCEDGSGTLVITEDVRFDFSVIDPASLGTGEVATGTWTIEGLGDYEDLTGSGEAVVNFDQATFHYTGEVED